MAATTFNPATTGSSGALSNGNLTLTITDLFTVAGSRVFYGALGGKFYVEFITYNAYYIGFANANAQINTYNTVGAIVVDQYGAIQSNGGGSVANIGGAVAGQQVAAAFDIDNYKVWFRLLPSGVWNGSSYNGDPGSGIGGITPNNIGGGPYFAYAMCYGQNTSSQVTGNFGATPMAGTPPAGFTIGWGDNLPVAPGAIVPAAKALILA